MTNDLTHIFDTTNQLMKDLLLEHMLNPKNDDFYIGTLTLEKTEAIFNTITTNKHAFASIFWDAYHTASQIYRDSIESQLEYQEYEEIRAQEAQPDPFTCCPNCGCSVECGYVAGLPCPNCEYTE